MLKAHKIDYGYGDGPPWVVVFGLKLSWAVQQVEGLVRTLYNLHISAGNMLQDDVDTSGSVGGSVTGTLLDFLLLWSATILRVLFTIFCRHDDDGSLGGRGREGRRHG